MVINYFGNHLLPGIKNINPPSPIELLSVIAYANCIITHSYHVFILSLNLNTKVFINTRSFKNLKSYNRFSTVIEMFKLKGLESEICNIDNNIDWDKFNSILKREREESINYLKRMSENDL